MSSALTGSSTLDSFSNVDFSICWNSSGENTSLNMVKRKIESAEGAFYMVDLGLIASHYHRWTRLLPRVRPFFAIKCNPDDMVIGMLMALGAGFDCASEGEVQAVRRHVDRYLGHSPHHQEDGGTTVDDWMARNIIFANPVKMRHHMRYAKSTGVEWTTFDSIVEMKKIAKEWPEAKLVLRIVPPRVFKAVVQFEGKFGACTSEIPTLLAAARQLNLDVVGVSFHVGSGCNEAEAWSETIIYAHKVFKMMRHFGYSPYLLDLGGGFHGVTAFPTEESRETVSAFERACDMMNATLDQYFPQQEGYTIIAEPGRYFVEAGYTLATKVIGKHSIRSVAMSLDDAWKQCCDSDDSEALAQAMENELYAEALAVAGEEDDDGKKAARVRYYLDDSVYASFNCNIFDVAIEMLCFFHVDPATGELEQIDASAPKYPSKIYGATCDSADCIRKICDLPSLSEGDWIVWRDAGAYTMSAGCPFNGIPLPPLSYFVCSDQLDLLPEIASSFSMLYGRDVVLSSDSESGDPLDERERKLAGGDAMVTEQNVASCVKFSRSLSVSCAAPEDRATVVANSQVEMMQQIDHWI